MRKSLRISTRKIDLLKFRFVSLNDQRRALEVKAIVRTL